MPTGKVKWFNADKGYGFIEQPDGPDVMVHSQILDRPTKARFVDAHSRGARVEFEARQGDKGLNATRVAFVDPAPEYRICPRCGEAMA